ncbi:hypothetical protein B0H14DRAFT_2658351 [Mycena olivaceomarginata]|nr:hypothetical protein B0H14DRAFT_2658351 [Mycena olivaceomarginata]
MPLPSFLEGVSGPNSAPSIAMYSSIFLQLGFLGTITVYLALKDGPFNCSGSYISREIKELKTVMKWGDVCNVGGGQAAKVVNQAIGSQNHLSGVVVIDRDKTGPLSTSTQFSAGKGWADLPIEAAQIRTCATMWVKRETTGDIEKWIVLNPVVTEKLRRKCCCPDTGCGFEL